MHNDVKSGKLLACKYQYLSGFYNRIIAGASGSTVVEVVTSIEALSVALYGPDLDNTIIQELCAKLVKITIVKASQTLTTAQKVGKCKFIWHNVLRLALNINKYRVKLAVAPLRALHHLHEVFSTF